MDQEYELYLNSVSELLDSMETFKTWLKYGSIVVAELLDLMETFRTWLKYSSIDVAELLDSTETFRTFRIVVESVIVVIMLLVMYFRPIGAFYLC